MKLKEKLISPNKALVKGKLTNYAMSLVESNLNFKLRALSKIMPVKLSNNLRNRSFPPVKNEATAR